MNHLPLLFFLGSTLSLGLVACGGGGGGATTTGTSTSTGSGTGGSGAGGSSTGGAAPSVPLIGDVLDCGKTGTPGSLAPGKGAAPLLRHDLDHAQFPDALCNDGTPAIFYYRPASSAADADKWVIQLQGGGSCQAGDDCAGRWCNEGTNFSMVGMSSAPAPGAAIDGHGILARPDEFPAATANPLATYNQVFIKYCSSDKWMGTGKDVVLDGHHPLTLAAVRYRAHFLGRRILEATLSTLRRDGVPALDYQGASMPDLDDAKVVVLAGASGGGAGVCNNGDMLRDLLAQQNPGLGEVRLLIDSIMGPEKEHVGFAATPLCTDGGLCTAEAVLAADRQQQETAWKPLRDQSCLAHHAGEEWRCNDEAHLILHHITTPMFVRMGLTDELLSDPYTQMALTDEAGAPYDLQKFGLKVRAQLLSLATIQADAEEGDQIGTVPAAFGPLCSKHETLRSDPDTFEATIDPGAGPRTMFEVFTAWRAGTAKQLVSSSLTDTVCPK